VGKLLSWVILILLGLIVLRLIAHQNAQSKINARQPRQAPRRKARPVAANDETESMVRCAHCGIHLPRSEAVLISGKTWCSKEHARLGVRQ
jgi:uncharacterized protein